MKNIKLNVLAGLLLASSAAFGGSIDNSPHDLAGWAGAADNGEICVYCHTPHAGNTLTDVPLWNKAANTTTFTMYAATIGGTAQAAGVANPSLACLSCHDGVSSIDSIINAPGSGLGSITANDTMSALTDGTVYSTVSNLTADLRKTHPISIPYNGTDGATNAAEVGSPASLRPKTADLATVSGSAWIGAETIQDLLRGGSDNIECASCHDPHNGGNTQGTATEVNFLRHSNTNSNLCLGCHDK